MDNQGTSVKKAPPGRLQLALVWTAAIWPMLDVEEPALVEARLIVYEQGSGYCPTGSELRQRGPLE